MTTPRPARPQRPAPRSRAAVSTAAPRPVATQAQQAQAPKVRRVKSLEQLAHGLTRATHEDDTGRRWAVLIPPGREHETEMGIVLGPPDFRGILADVPEPALVRLHNELFERGLITERDLRGRTAELLAALQAAFRVDVTTLVNAYRYSGEQPLVTGEPSQAQEEGGP